MATNYSYIPHAPLATFVESFWLSESSGERVHGYERRLPDGSASLVINLRDDLIRVYDLRDPDQFQRCRGIVLSGARSEDLV